MDFVNTVLPIVVIVLFVLVFAITIIYSILAERRRSEALQQLAAEMGFSYQKNPTSGTEAIQFEANYDLFQRGRSRRFSNMLQGRREDFEMKAFDYSYVTGGGRHSTTHHQSVVMMLLEHSELATFSLRPESLFDKLASKFGKVDINFENRPEFSKKYHLSGEDEIAVQRLFSNSVIDFCENQRNLHLEATADRLVMYYPGWRAKPEEFRAFMDNAVKILVLLRRPTTAGWGELYDFGKT